MQESNTPDSNSGNHGRGSARHRRPTARSADRTGPVRRLFTGRRPIIAIATAAVLGLGIAGVAAATSRGDDNLDRTSVAADARARAEAADRANRANRESRTPGAAASEGLTGESADPQADPAESSPSPTGSSASPAGAASSATQPQAKPSKSTAQPGRTTQATPNRTSAAPATTTKPPTTGTNAAWVHPMPGAPTTSCYGQRWGTLHAGIDLAKPADTPIQAAGAGTVTIAGWAYTGYGISVIIDHGNNIFTHYAHQNRTAVSVGQKVTAGQVIGYEGSTGDSTGPHLHFEVHQGMWNQVDPGPWMRQRGVDLGC